MSRSTLKTTAIKAEIRQAPAAAATPPVAAGKKGAPKDKAAARERERVRARAAVEVVGPRKDHGKAAEPFGILTIAARPFHQLAMDPNVVPSAREAVADEGLECPARESRLGAHAGKLRRNDALTQLFFARGAGVFVHEHRVQSPVNHGDSQPDR